MHEVDGFFPAIGCIDILIFVGCVDGCIENISWRETCKKGFPIVIEAEVYRCTK